MVALARLHGPDEPVYVISVAARLLGVSQQALRQYERSGLLAPARTPRQTRLYSQRDLVRVQRILALVHGRGVNLAGARLLLETGSRRRAAPRPDGRRPALARDPRPAPPWEGQRRRPLRHRSQDPLCDSLGDSHHPRQEER